MHFTVGKQNAKETKGKLQNGSFKIQKSEISKLELLELPSCLFGLCSGKLQSGTHKTSSDSQENSNCEF